MSVARMLMSLLVPYVNDYYVYIIHLYQCAVNNYVKEGRSQD